MIKLSKLSQACIKNRLSCTSTCVVRRSSGKVRYFNHRIRLLFQVRTQWSVFLSVQISIELMQAHVSGRSKQKILVLRKQTFCFCFDQIFMIQIRRFSRIRNYLPLSQFIFIILQFLIYKLNTKIISFIYNNLMLFRIFGNFWFCADKFRYNAAETVLSIVFNSNFKTTLVQDQKIIQLSYLLLHDQIFQKLNQMLPKDQKIQANYTKMIDIQTYDLFKKMFTPSQGIQYQKLIYFSQSERLKKAQNKNNLIAFCLDPIMFKLILKQMYIKNINAKLMKNQLADNVIYIVGTPGLGKSVKFIAAKILLDMRIRHIIKNSVQNQSQFAQNYKFFYFHAQTNKKDIMSKTLEEVKQDFDVVPSQITSIKIHPQNFIKFMSEVSSIYFEKNIRLRLILDQMNFIYNAAEKERYEQIRKWKDIRECFELPVIMVSSKNNQYLEKYDPVIYFANSSNNNIRHIKIILDNLITPQQRFAYSFNCFAFELFKFDLPRSNMIEILKNASLPLLTHLTISKIVKNVFQEQNGSLDNKNNMIKFNQKLKQKINQIEILDNVKNMLKSSRLQSQKLNYYLEFMSNFLSFSLKNTSSKHISLNIGLKDANGNASSVIQKQIKIATREIRKNQSFRIMAESNYFFTTQINTIISVFSCISVQQMNRIRDEIGRYISTKFLKNLQKKDVNLLTDLIQNNGGFIFQEFVCSLYTSVLNKQKVVNTLITGNKSLFHQAYMAGYMSQMNKKESYLFLYKKEDRFLKNASGKPVFDFILSSLSTNAKRLIFVDTTLSDRLMPLIVKQCKFKKIMFQKIKEIKQQKKILNEQEQKQNKTNQQPQKKQQEQKNAGQKQIATKNQKSSKSKQTQGTQKQIATKNQKSQKSKQETRQSKSLQIKKQEQKEQLTSFGNQIFNLLNSNSNFTLQIIYYVLTARKSEFKNFYEKIEQSESQVLKQLEQLPSDDDLTKKKKKENRQIMEKGRQNFDKFKEFLKKNGLESRVNILFMHGALTKQQFITTSVHYPKDIKGQIKVLPQYLVKTHKQILGKQL